MDLTRDSDGKHYSAEIIPDQPISARVRSNQIDMKSVMSVATETIEALLGPDRPPALRDLRHAPSIRWFRGTGKVQFTHVDLPGNGVEDTVLQFDPTLGTFAHSAILCTCEGSLASGGMLKAPIKVTWTVDLSKFSPDALKMTGDGGQLVLRPQDLVTYHHCSGIEKAVADVAA